MKGFSVFPKSEKKAAGPAPPPWTTTPGLGGQKRAREEEGTGGENSSKELGLSPAGCTGPSESTCLPASCLLRYVHALGTCVDHTSRQAPPALMSEQPGKSLVNRQDCHGDPDWDYCPPTTGPGQSDVVLIRQEVLAPHFLSDVTLYSLRL